MYIRKLDEKNYYIMHKFKKLCLINKNIYVKKFKNI